MKNFGGRVSPTWFSPSLLFVSSFQAWFATGSWPRPGRQPASCGYQLLFIYLLMPPKKRRRQSQKAQLLFHQQPLEGPKHHYESCQQPITHTVQVPSKPIDQSTVTSWVGPGNSLTFTVLGFSEYWLWFLLEQGQGNSYCSWLWYCLRYPLFFLHTKICIIWYWSLLCQVPLKSSDWTLNYPVAGWRS